MARVRVGKKSRPGNTSRASKAAKPSKNKKAYVSPVLNIEQPSTSHEGRKLMS